jgi:hypothetical protein
MLAWASPVNDKVGTQLKNCLIELSEGTLKRIGQLREPVTVEPITLDLDSDTQVIETRLEDAPRSGAQGMLRFEIVELSGFSPAANVRTGTAPTLGIATPPVSPFATAPASAPEGLASLPVLTQSIIEFTDIPALELRVVVREAAGHFAISVEPYYRETPTAPWRNLRPTAQLDRLERDEQRSRSAAKQRIQSPEKSLRFWEKEVEEAEGDQPNPTSKGYPKWQQRMSKAKAKAAEYKRSVDSELAIITKADALLELIPKLRDFIQGSHEQAKIRYVIYSECGDRDLLLIDGRGQQSGGQP